MLEFIFGVAKGRRTDVIVLAVALTAEAEARGCKNLGDFKFVALCK